MIPISKKDVDIKKMDIIKNVLTLSGPRLGLKTSIIRFHIEISTAFMNNPR